MVRSTVEVYPHMRGHVNGGICPWVWPALCDETVEVILLTIDLASVIVTAKTFSSKKAMVVPSTLTSTVSSIRFVGAGKLRSCKAYSIQGMTFEKPEAVPFRLTHNMIDAFGAYGYDGE